MAKVIFLHLSVIHSVHRGGGGLPQCMLGYPPPGADTPPEQTPPGSRHLPEADTNPPGSRYPPGADTPPGSSHLPPGADSSIRSTSGRYASYWNAFLLLDKLNNKTKILFKGIKLQITKTKQLPLSYCGSKVTHNLGT